MSQGQQEPLLNSKYRSISTFSESNFRFLILDRKGSGFLTGDRWAKLLNEGHKHGCFQSVCGLGWSHFFNSLGCAPGASGLLSPFWTSGFNGHMQALPNKYPRIWIVFIWRALCIILLKSGWDWPVCGQSGWAVLFVDCYPVCLHVVQRLKSHQYDVHHWWHILKGCLAKLAKAY